MNVLRRSLMAAGLAAGLLTSVVSFAAKPKEIVFGIISTEASSIQKKMFDPLLADMEKAIGIPVKGFYASDYAGVIEAMRFNKVQVAWYGNKAAMQAVDRSSGEIFVQTVALDGSMGYYSLLITHKDLPYKNMQDVLKDSKNIRFGNGDPNSTSGFLVPAYYVFALNNVDPKQSFKVVTTASHENNALAVANKQVDVATFNTESWTRLQQNKPDAHANLREIWRSPLIPGDPLVYRKDLDADTKKKIKSFFMTYGQASGAEGDRQREILKPHEWKGFVDSSNDQLIPIRQLELFKDKRKIENDTKLSASDKTKQLADIEKQLAALDARAKAIKK